MNTTQQPVAIITGASSLWGPWKRACSSGRAFEVDHAGREQGFGTGVRGE